MVLLRDLCRPRCLFGWRASVVDLYDFESDRLEDDRDLKDAAEMHAFVLYANLVESVLAVGHGLPKDCSPDGITWF